VILALGSNELNSTNVICEAGGHRYIIRERERERERDDAKYISSGF